MVISLEEVEKRGVRVRVGCGSTMVYMVCRKLFCIVPYEKPAKSSDR